MAARTSGRRHVLIECAATPSLDLLQSLARLHSVVYPNSGLASYGENFLVRLYEHLIEGPNSFVLVALSGAERELAGCLVIACDLPAVYKSFVVRHPLVVAWLMTTRLLKSSALRRIFEILRYPRRAGSPTRDYPKVEIVNLCVSPAFQRMGVGAKLFEAMRKELLARDVHRLKIVTGEDQTAAQRLYESRGASLAETIEVHRGQRSLVYVLDVEAASPRAEPSA